jgi:hypothetical protein
MGRANQNNKVFKTYEWRRGVIANIGTVAVIPYDVIFHHIKDKNLNDVIELFFNNNTKKIGFIRPLCS